MRHLYKYFCSFSYCLAFTILGSTPSNSTNVLVGNCNQVTQNIVLHDQATLYIENDCFADTPDKTFRVRYIWLDSLSLSLIMAGFADENLQLIVGKSPYIWHGAKYDEIKDILNKFGGRPTAQSKHFGTTLWPKLLSGNGELSLNAYRLNAIPENVRRTLKIYDGETPILWPDSKAYEEFYLSSEWPLNYKMSYKTNNLDYTISTILSNTKDADRETRDCSFLHGYVSRNDFLEYPLLVRQMAKKLETNSLPHPYDPEQPYDNTELATYFTSYSAMKYFGAHNWPDDFLVRYGAYYSDACAGIAGLGIQLLPRELFVLVAVVEATGKQLDLEGFGYHVDQTQGLRDHIQTSSYSKDEYSLPRLKRGDTIVVPLRVELRYNLEREEFHFLHKNNQSGQIHSAIRSLNREITIENGVGPDKRVLKKPSTSFRDPQFNHLKRTYYFGSVYDLKHVLIGGNAYAVRKTPRLARLTSSGFEEGSCPFLEFVEADGQRSLHGRILVGANGHNNTYTEKLQVPLEATSIIISEREPEISYIKNIDLIKVEDGSRISLAKHVVLKPWQSLELQVPMQIRNNDLLLEISGYYVQLNSVVAFDDR